MTRTRYMIATFLQYFGVGRKVKRLTDAAFETHLMQDGEEILGAYCWKNIENIEELSMEYWNLRRLEREGFEVVWAPIDDGGLIDLAVLAGMVDERTIAVSVMAVNNEIGVIQPFRQRAGANNAADIRRHDHHVVVLLFPDIAEQYRRGLRRRVCWSSVQRVSCCGV